MEPTALGGDSSLHCIVRVPEVGDGVACSRLLTAAFHQRGFQVPMTLVHKPTLGSVR